MMIANQNPNGLFYTWTGAGKSETVVFLHGSLSSGGQWRNIAAELAPQFEVILPDLPGYGRSSAVESQPSALGRRVRLRDHVTAVETAILDDDRPIHLVGHSFGGAVALACARAWPDRVKSLTLYEPVSFHLLRDGDASDRDHFLTIRSLAVQMTVASIMKRQAEGAKRFIEFWNGAGFWDSLPAARQDAYTRQLRSVLNDFDAVFDERWPVGDCAEIRCPTLLMTGQHTLDVTRRIIELLADSIPRAHHVVIPDAGHMAPVTHGDAVGTLVSAQLRRNSLVQQEAQPRRGGARAA